MAPHAQHNANHFATSSEHPADYSTANHHSTRHVDSSLEQRCEPAS
ncbi:hypothetical protein [Psychrobacter glacincola]|nr:hypothetical protein [Psychrobacter glacincola]